MVALNPEAWALIEKQMNSIDQNLMSDFLHPNFQVEKINYILELYNNLVTNILWETKTQISIDVSEVSDYIIKIFQAINLYKASLEIIKDKDISLIEVNQKLLEIEKNLEEFLKIIKDQASTITELNKTIEQKDSEIETLEKKWTKDLENQKIILTKEKDEEVKVIAAKLNTAISEKMTKNEVAYVKPLFQSMINDKNDLNEFIESLLKEIELLKKPQIENTSETEKENIELRIKVTEEKSTNTKLNEKVIALGNKVTKLQLDHIDYVNKTFRFIDEENIDLNKENKPEIIQDKSPEVIELERKLALSEGQNIQLKNNLEKTENNLSILETTYASNLVKIENENESLKNENESLSLVKIIKKESAKKAYTDTTYRFKQTG